MEKTFLLVSVLLLIGANILATLLLVKIRKEFITTFSHTVRSLVTEWNKVSKTVTILTHGIDLEEKPLTGDLRTPNSEDDDEIDEKAMSPSKRALYQQARENKR
ncbi:MAG: hypothetical protein ACC669_09345 [bacterium]